MPVLTAKGLTKSFGPRVILDGVDLAIERGERVGLVGINGGGKSTLARIVAGAMEPDAGEVVQLLRDLDGCRRACNVRRASA